MYKVKKNDKLLIVFFLLFFLISSNFLCNSALHNNIERPVSPCIKLAQFLFKAE